MTRFTRKFSNAVHCPCDHCDQLPPKSCLSYNYGEPKTENYPTKVWAFE